MESALIKSKMRKKWLCVNGWDSVMWEINCEIKSSGLKNGNGGQMKSKTIHAVNDGLNGWMIDGMRARGAIYNAMH